MQPRWDNGKNEANAKNHGLRFETAATVFEGDYIEFEDNRYRYDEERYVAIGFARDGNLTTVVYTERDETLRIICAWRSNAHERQRFERRGRRRRG